MTTMAAQSIQAFAPAKVNLTLAVLGRRADGFHELESWVVPIGWYDRVRVSLSKPSITVSGPESEVPADESNIAWRAVEAMAAALRCDPDVALELEKHIPNGAGLGGGSSDAAVVICLLNDLWEAQLSYQDMQQIAARVGSDVPLFLDPRGAVIKGRGEQVEELPGGGWSGWIGLVAPPFSLSTARVYAGWNGPHRKSCPQPWKQHHSDCGSLMSTLFNDLESAAFAAEPRLAELHGQLDGLEGRAIRMTGSGSTLFTAFDNLDQAGRWQAAVSAIVDPAVSVHVFETVSGWKTQQSGASCV